ncbi:MAG: Peptidase S26B, signal peptidase [Microgenomates bacterium 39_7]|nr:MAG: Peptidase S26B, signal peptidase [Microgenomates bacterium 39_7]
MKEKKNNHYPTQLMPIFTLTSIIITLIGYGYLNGYRLFVIASGSMEPSLSVGTLVVTVPRSRYYPRQVITYYKTVPYISDQESTIKSYSNSNGSSLIQKPYSKPRNIAKAYSARDIFKSPDVTNAQQYAVTHRIISSLADGEELFYRTQGDANPYPDTELVHHNSVVGKVWLAIPLLGYLFLLPHYRIGFYFIVLLPTMLLIMSHLIKIFKLLISFK